jgi:glutamyl-tRNA reductase
VGISSVAVGTAARQLGSLRDRFVLVVGLGAMGTQALKTLLGRNVANICLTNRTVARAQRLAEMYEMTHCTLDEMPDAIAHADLVISATSAPEAMIDLSMVAEAMRDRPDRPLLLIDIAVPRDIDPAVDELDNVQYYDVDHLNRGVDEALAERRREVPRAEQIIAEVCDAFDAELRQLAIEPVVADFRRQAEDVRRQELARTLQFLGPDVDPETVAHIQHLSHALVNKLLHEPTARLKAHASAGNAEDILPAFQELFGLPSINNEASDNGSRNNGVHPKQNTSRS